MISIKAMVAIGIGIFLPLFALFFVPYNVFFGDDSNSTIPSAMMILGNDSDETLQGFKITPINCIVTPAGFHEYHFQVTNTHEKDYGIMMSVSFTDNQSTLYEKEIDIVLLAGQTVNQAHPSDDVYENPICVAQINSWYEIE
ncbi:MAG: hypothetical protein K5777_07160 [Nitrosopumilus sp.]|nr:hypothetical protein [Nitrosopumilus sp.]